MTGPESIAEFNGNVFVSSEEGFIYKIEGEKIRPVVKLINNQCLEPWDKSVCGRPLGIKFDSKGVLYVVEPYSGIFTVQNILSSTPKVTKIFDIKQTESLGKVSKFLDDIAIYESLNQSEGNVLYISDVSTKYDLSQSMIIISGSETGRIIKYDMKTKKVEILVKGILFPNGVELTDDKSAILFAECAAKRIFKHYIRGSKKGQTEIFVSGLAGEPDNIRRSATKDETYWIAVAMARNQTNPSTLEFLEGKPLIRKFILRLFNLIGSGIESVGNIFKNAALKEFGFKTKNGVLIINSFEGKHGLVIEVDKDGNIVQSLHSPDGSINMLSEAKEVRLNDKETVLYLGSFINKYLAKLNLKNRI